MRAEQKGIIAGCYCRLSDDDAQDGTSVSIETQMKLLGDYCRQNGYKVYDIYKDDGYTGTNFNRPDFQRMINDAESGKINAIIVKDLSRFGRNYVQVGNYMSDILPRMGVRFIAIGDDVDSAKGNIDYDLMIPIKNVFNEYYPADCSRKTRQAFISKASSGEYIGSHAPYGYKKSPEDKHILIIDEEAAQVVKRIFEMAAYENYGYNKIARVLSERKILTPSAYRAMKQGKEFTKNPYDWNLGTVYTIFQNEAYIGNLISGKRRIASFKNKRTVKKDKSEWIIVNNTHEPIISEQLWEDAHERLAVRKSDGKSTYGSNIFAGLLVCDKCGQSLGAASGKDRRLYYVCNKYKKKGSPVCTSHFIMYQELYDAILSDLKQIQYAIKMDKEAFIKQTLQKSSDTKMSTKKAMEKECAELTKRQAELEKRFDRMYDDRLDGLLSDRKFKEMSEKIEKEQTVISDRLEELNRQLNEGKSAEKGLEHFIETIEQYEMITVLDRKLLGHLIDKIVVKDRPKEKGTMQTITIYYRFIGVFHSLD